MDRGGAVGFGDGEGAVGGDMQLPTALVGQVMMPSAERGQVVDVGQALFDAVVGEVMDLRVLERCVSQRTRPMERSQGPSLGTIRQSGFATEEQPHAVGADDDGRDLADARPAAHGLHR